MTRRRLAPHKLALKETVACVIKYNTFKLSEDAKLDGTRREGNFLAASSYRHNPRRDVCFC